MKSSTTSPVTIPGLKNGTSYTFSITALNSNGSSDPINTPAVTPTPAWKSSVIDSKSDAARVVSTSFNGQPLLAYFDSRSGDLRIAMWDKKNWVKRIVDGAGGSSGRTTHPITGALSLCVNGSGTKQTLHIFYADGVDKDLRYAKFDGKNFIYEVVDGNASAVNLYEDPIRVRTASDVSVSSACIASASGVQVFYRDESQGVLLGAVKTNISKSWTYELVDGDRKTDGRTTGDVAFHLASIFDGKNSYVLYDSVLTINQKKEVTSGEVRLATRSSFSPTGWNFRTLEAASAPAPIHGFDVAFGRNVKSIIATWLSATSVSLPGAASVHWEEITGSTPIKEITTELYGEPSQFISTDGSSIAFNCQFRLCAMDITKNPAKISFVSTSENPDGISSTWVIVNRVKYLVAGVNGQLSMLRP